MKKILFYLFLYFLCGSSMNIAATVDAPDFRSVPWNERTYTTVLSRSFGDVTLRVRSQGDREVESIVVEVLGKKILIPLEQLIGIEELGEPDLSIANEGNENEELRIFFEYGAPVRVREDSGSDWVRQVLTIAINLKGQVKIVKQ
ncbi:hypothetical protein [Microbulbifer epialgicus]|uniref:Auto-transporter adhesin head GIN domain-containing protein n=1 Tax=Microbulbifer epialgicus TaxID=393907 RepID=A0ABV4P7H8_9GAMM